MTPSDSRNPAPLLRFHQWNDMHLHDAGVPGRRAGYPRCNEKAQWARGLVGEADLVLSAGDLIDGEIADFGHDFALLERMLLCDLRAPFLPCLGNHENQQGEGDPAANAAYDRFCGPGWRHYACTVAGVAFIVIDSSGGHRGADAVTDARLAFARRALQRVRSLPTFVVTHVPLIPMRDPAVLAESFGFSSWINLDPRLLALVESHADHVIAVLSGHLHITAARQRSGIWHIVPSGTAGYPADFAAHQLFPDRLHVRMHAAPAELSKPQGEGTPGGLGNIHGRERHGRDFTDADHPDAESYVSGTPGERDVTIALEAGKRPEASKAGDRLRIWHEQGDGDWREVRPFR